MKGGIILNCDNKSAAVIARNPVQHKQNKHKEIGCHFIEEKTEARNINLMFVPSSEHVLYTFVTGLPGKLFQENVVQAGNEQYPHTSIDKGC